MEKRFSLKYVSLDDLKLDVNNPRFGELYSGSTKEEDLIEYLLFEEAAEEIAAAIVRKKEFYEDKALWVIKDKDGKYIVRDGNRRCAAVKSLQLPSKYKLPVSKMIFETLPVYEYTDENELKSRISEEHAASLFRNWERIAKALQILDLAASGKKEEMESLDPRPGDFIKLGSFYKEAVKYGGDTFRKQLRRGRGKTGGKTIIYERLFKDAKLCGYRFRNSPNFSIEVADRAKFKQYITALVKYIQANPEIKTSDVDNNVFTLKTLKDYGFDAYHQAAPPAPTPNASPTPSASSGSPATEPTQRKQPDGTTPSATQTNSSQPGPPSSIDGDGNGASSPTDSIPAPATQPASETTVPASPNTRHSVKRKPYLKRKKIPAALKKLIDECFNISKDDYPNAKTALTRVTFECTLKYTIENSHYKRNKLLKKSNFFREVFVDSRGKTRPYMNFTLLKNKFTELILNTGIKNAFSNFDLDRPNQIIHNYHIIASPTDAESICINLMPLIEFMLQEEQELLNNLDLGKL